MKMDKWCHWCISCCAGCQSETHPLIKSTVPRSLIECAAHTLFPALSALTRHVYSEELVSKWPWVNRICIWLSKCHFIFKIQKIGKMGLSFTDLEQILKFLPRKKKFTDIKYNTHQVCGKSESYFPQLHLLPWMFWKESQYTTAGVGGRGGWGWQEQPTTCFYK